ncbi:hypothetical protein GP486_006719 [Trichoglossum hirsutum]|uniref:Heterokaryon incompatibility domain-containing protein n=1 Tax=Trichoglossum hirsutum TaxID=265104 RepID=A0A9P8I7L8_9PEZI|nr:hypothetical protein GP486_006719 [Trichoglossum hirsutum]
MSLCGYCTGITLEKIYACDRYDHQPSWHALRKSSAECSLCEVFYDRLNKELCSAFLSDPGQSHHPEEHIRKSRKLDQLRLAEDWDAGLKTNIILQFPEDNGKTLWYITVVCGGQAFVYSHISDNGAIMLKEATAEHGFGRRGAAEIMIYTLEDDPLASQNISIGRLINPDPTSDANFSMATNWINECVTMHPECSITSMRTAREADSDKKMPKRVIDVKSSGESGSIVLIDTDGKMIEYVTLSYCWGPIEKPLWVTKKYNLEDRKKNISVLSLPKTLRDAVTVVRKLGYHYLWVDSLCILQDSPEDWEEESACMGQYYENSAFTIAASSAESSVVGFLNARTPVTYTPIVIPVDRGEGPRGHLYIPRRLNTFGTNITFGPLSERAWVLQERMFSRGILHYGKEQMFWECQSALRNESTLEDVSRGNILDPAFYEHNLRIPFKPSKRALTLLQWYGIIEDYTTRKMTRDMDKLPALSGLANEAQKQFGVPYLAGLWNDKLHIGLSWSVLHNSSGRRPLIYRAPSWSWAAVDGPISYQYLNGYTPTSDGFVESAIDVIEAHTEIAASDQFGQVVGGRIVLSGQLKFAKKEEMLPNKVLTYYDWKMGHEKMIGYYIEDEQNELGDDILCLKLAIRPFGIGPSLSPQNVVLILGPTGSGAYRRVGSGIIKQTNWFDDSLRRVITMI